MSTGVRQRPAARPPANGGAPARRAVIRWAWRLFRREWRQQLLVLGLLVAAVAATTAGAAIAANAPSSPDASFGTAGYLLTISGSGRYLAADISAARKWFGEIEVIEHQSVAIPGSVNTVDLRAQNPAGPFGFPMLRLDAGHYPRGPGQVAVTAQVAAIYRLTLGRNWREGGRSRRVVGLVENPQNLQDAFALVAPGQATPPTQVTILLDATTARVEAFRPPGGISVPFEDRTASTNFPPAAVLVFSVIGLLFVGLVAVAGFAVMAGRRLRALGMLGAVGATGRHVRLAMIAHGAILGVAAALLGAAAGLAGWFAFAPRLETITEHRIDWLSLPWPIIATGLLLAFVTAVAAAWWPARTAARIPIVAALSGRPPRPQPGHRFAGLGGALLAAGLGLLAFANHSVNSHHASPALTVGGTVGTVGGMLLLGPLAIRGLARLGGRSPIAARLALRDIVRYQARSGAALAAASLTLGISAAIAVGAAGAQATAAIPPSGGNLPPNQLIVYLAASADLSGSGGGGPIPVPRPLQLRHAQAGADAIAASVGARTVLALDTAASASATGQAVGAETPGLQPAALVKGSPVTVNGKKGYAFSPPPNAGQLYLATAALLRHYRIAPGSIDPAADILTSRTDLAGYELTDFANQPACGGAPSCRVHEPKLGHGVPKGPPGIAHPVIQRVRLPAYTSAPNILITETAIRALHLTVLPAGWLIQTPRPLTAAQVIAADHLAAAAGLTIETRSRPAAANSARLATEASGVGALLALGVLAMTIGLIRSETAADMRVLAAAGASSTTRRSVSAVTAGALALLGAVIGTGGAYLALIAWHHGVGPLSHVPVASLIITLAGLPLLATAGTWLLAGREPPAIGRKPLA
jgi:putative ABC transport system permease protein